MRAPRQQSFHACAACKYQRRKCHPNCIMARYFPANRTKEFLDIHRLFGVSNVIKMYNSLPVANRDTFMETLLYEAQMRRKYPVDGCLKVIRDLSSEIEAAKKELEDVRKQIEFHKNQAQRTELMKAMQQQQQLMPLKQSPQFGGLNLQPSLPTLFHPNWVSREYGSSSSHPSSLKNHLDAEKVKSGHSDEGQQLVKGSSITIKAIKMEPEETEEQIVFPKNQEHGLDSMKLMPLKQEQQFDGEQLQPSSTRMLNSHMENRESDSSMGHLPRLMIHLDDQKLKPGNFSGNRESDSSKGHLPRRLMIRLDDHKLKPSNSDSKRD